jgi:hypothetical protein
VPPPRPPHPPPLPPFGDQLPHPPPLDEPGVQVPDGAFHVELEVGAGVGVMVTKVVGITGIVDERGIVTVEIAGMAGAMVVAEVMGTDETMADVVEVEVEAVMNVVAVTVPAEIEVVEVAIAAVETVAVAELVADEVTAAPFWV